MTATASPVTGMTWGKILWQGEPAWISTEGSVRAVISEARCRLIYLGAADGNLNLLNAPTQPALPATRTAQPNQGGHRFWLGPQHRWGWPPLPEWESSAAQVSSTDKSVLTLHHPRFDHAYPAIVREYAWEGVRLRCTARWQDESGQFFGLHIVAVDTPVSVNVRLASSKTAPDGFVTARMIDPPTAPVLPHPALTISGTFATVHTGASIAKLGFPPQSLVVGRDRGWQLAMHPGPHAGLVLEYPDNGYLSQVWVGDPTHTFAELEQLTPCLKGDSSGHCASTIYLEARPPLS